MAAILPGPATDPCSWRIRWSASQVSRRFVWAL